MRKLAIVINGSGGVGKDTLCGLAAKHFSVMNVSSVTPIKDLARRCGWDGKKDRRSRKFLSDLKRICSIYNDFPNRWVLERFHEFIEDTTTQIMFVHIREAKEIEKFVRSTDGRAKTLLIRGGDRFVRHAPTYGNASDDEVENYPYDFVYVNEHTLDVAETEFCDLLYKIMDTLADE